MDTNVRSNPTLARMVESLQSALGDRLVSVVLYGSAARGDYTAPISDLNLLVVVDALEPAVLERLHGPFTAWQKKRQPMPRVFSPPMLAASVDVFPIEFLELLQRHVVLAGRDPLDGLEVHNHFLRLQCERELREKLMRLREAFIEIGSNDRRLSRLMAESYSAFAAIFRGCLHLLGGEPPVATQDVIRHFCSRASLDTAPFLEVERLRHGNRASSPVRALFDRYYGELTKAVDCIDRFGGADAADA